VERRKRRGKKRFKTLGVLTEETRPPPASKKIPIHPGGREKKKRGGGSGRKEGWGKKRRPEQSPGGVSKLVCGWIIRKGTLNRTETGVEGGGEGTRD